MSRSKGDLTEITLSSPIREEGEFSLHTGNWPDPMWTGQRGYFIVNKRTGLIEGVFGTEASGIRELALANLELDQALKGGGAVSTSDDIEFQAMMQRLNEKNREH